MSSILLNVGIESSQTTYSKNETNATQKRFEMNKIESQVHACLAYV